MRMKQITAATIQDALALARRELGEDALMLESKKSAKGGMIVTFAIEEEDDLLPDFAPPAPVNGGQRRITDTVPERRASSQAFAPTDHDILAPAEAEHPALAMITEAVRYHSIPLAFAERLLARMYKVRLKSDHVLEVAEAALAEALASVLVFKPIATAAKPPTRALMLVGPHGAGKTSTIGKLATELTLNKQPLVLISCDMERLGGTESLQQLADILKCPFHTAENRAELKTRIAQHQDKAWVLVDSSGANIYEFAQLKSIGELAGLQGIEPILTCPAGMDTSEAQEMASVFNFLTIERMIVTRLDAVRRLGSLFAAISTGGYALSNLTNSALQTDACTPLSAPALARLMLRHVRERTSH